MILPGYWSLLGTSCTKTNTLSAKSRAVRNFTFGSNTPLLCTDMTEDPNTAQSPVLVLPGANCYWSARITWSQSATPNGCNAWLLPEDIFTTDRICTPLPILWNTQSLICMKNVFESQVARIGMIRFLKEWRREKWCAMSRFVSTPGPYEVPYI